jgi:hypothetical protein
MKLSQLSSETFRSAVTKLSTASLPPKTAFQIKKLIQSLESDLKIFEETRNAIVNEYCLKDENGQPVPAGEGMVTLDMTRVAEWQPKIDELMSLETTVELPKFSIEALGDKVELSATDLFALGDLITE